MDYKQWLTFFSRSPKGWARLKNIDRFIENSRNLQGAEMIQNAEFTENKKLGL